MSTMILLRRVTPQNQSDMRHMIDTFNCVEDCPIFSDMYDFCRMYAGGSLAGARKLCAGTTDIAINWAGGLHHAKRGEASGFCYVNDIVLAILELLRSETQIYCHLSTKDIFLDTILESCTLILTSTTATASSLRFTKPTGS